MARQQTILRVFVASPGDVAEERTALEDVIRELNTTWSRTVGIVLELVKWETHTRPGVGTDAQAVINEQVGDDYDIFVGIMWTRFGTATKRAGSGTTEEFNRAYARYQQNPDGIRIMFYFKDAAVSPSELDLEQLALMKAFQKDLGEKGTYYWTYTSRDDFVQLLRMHLAFQVQEWRKSWGKEETKDIPSRGLDDVSAIAAEQSKEDEENLDDEEQGYIDLMLVAQESFQTMNEAMGRMTAAIQDLGSRIQQHTSELNRARTPVGEVDLKHAKRVTNRVAETMNNFSALMEVDVPVFAGSYSSAIDASTLAFTLTKDLGIEKREDVERTQATMQEFEGTLLSTQSQMTVFRETIANTPRATTELNRARKRTLAILDKLDGEYTTALNLNTELKKLLDQFLEN